MGSFQGRDGHEAGRERIQNKDQGFLSGHREAGREMNASPVVPEGDTPCRRTGAGKDLSSSASRMAVDIQLRRRSV